METTDQLVMPIVVSIDQHSSHTGIVQSVADAAMVATSQLLSPEGSELLHGHSLDVEEWLGTGMRKTTRAVKAAKFAKAVHSFSDDLRYAVHATPQVYVGTLKTYPQFTKFEKRAQVSGWDLSEKAPGALRTPGDDEPVIEVLSSLSTGKAAAAAAHVATLLVLSHTRGELLDVWGSISVQLVDVIDEDARSLMIRDAGHTEVEPQTVTAALRLP